MIKSIKSVHTLKNKKIRVLVADDHTMICESLEGLILEQPDMEVVGLAHHGEQVLQMLEKYSVDVLLLDITMPIMDGLDVLPKVRAEYPHVNILTLTTHDDGELVKAIMEGGALGYLLKSESCEHLISCIRMVASGQRVLNLDLTSKMLDSMQQSRRNIPAETVLITNREEEVLQLLSEGFTSQQISSKLFISENTVITHKKKLFVKFGVCNGASLVKKAMQHGLLREAS